MNSSVLGRVLFVSEKLCRGGNLGAAQRQRYRTRPPQKAAVGVKETWGSFGGRGRSELRLPRPVPLASAVRQTLRLGGRPLSVPPTTRQEWDKLGVHRISGVFFFFSFFPASIDLSKHFVTEEHK